jgi:Pyruvate/2-oxoacid:ferredoxin oxidoreductase delta subunit
MAKYIEREALIAEYDRVHKGPAGGSRKLMVDAPTADVVEVVRCKDCRHFCPYEGEEHKGDCNELVGLESCVYEDDFCSYGEAKMDGKGEG